MARKLALAIIGLNLLINGGGAFALGLGKHELNSYLNQPLRMDIELHQVRDLAPTEIVVKLASQDEYSRAGVARDFFHTDLKFEVIINEEEGSGVIKVTSKKPVREPFINFLIDIHWPQGKFIREYTLLLDPPNYSIEKAAEPVAPAQSSQPAQTEQTETVQQTTTQTSTQQAAPEPAAVESTPAEAAAAPEAVVAVPVERTPAPAPTPTATYSEYVVDSDDTMWSIASRNRASNNVSVQQTMLAIQRLNPDAFIDGNINLLKKGAVLRLPNEGEVRDLSARDAMSDVADQNEAWREKLRRKGIADPTRAQVSGARDSSTFDQFNSGAREGQVTLVTSESASQSAGGETSGQGGAEQRAEILQNQLAINEESLDSAIRKSEDLSGRVAALEAQLGTSEEILKVKDQEIAALKERLMRLQEEQGIDEPLPVIEEPLAQPTPVTDDVVEEVVVEEAVADDATGETETTEEVVAEEAVAETGDEAVVDEAIAEEVAETPAQPAPVEPAPVQPSSSSFWQDNLLLIVAGLVVILGLVGALVFRARKNKQQQVVSDIDYDAVQDFDAPEDDAGTADMGDEAAGAELLEEVERYIAYGNYQQAAEALVPAVQADTSRTDLQLKLLEVYAEAGDGENFEQAYALLQANGTEDELAAANQLREKIQDTPSLDELGLGLGEEQAADAGDQADLGLDDDLGGELDLGDLDADSADAGDDLGDFDLGGDLGGDDLDLDLGGAEDEPTSDDDGLGALDLDLGGDDEAGDELEDLSAELDLDGDLGGVDELEDVALDLDAELDAGLGGDDAAGDDDFALDLGDDDSLDLSDANLDADLDAEDDLAMDLDLGEDEPAAPEGASDDAFTPAEHAISDDEISEVDLGSLDELDEVEASLAASENEEEGDLDLDLSELDDLDSALEADLDADLEADLADGLDSASSGGSELDLDTAELESVEVDDLPLDADSLDASIDAELDELDALLEADDSDIGDLDSLDVDDELAQLDADLDTDLDADIALEEESAETLVSAPALDDVALDDLDTTLVDAPALDDDVDTLVGAPALDDSLAAEDETETAVHEQVETAIHNAIADPEELDDDAFMADADENATKLDLARAYIDMGDVDNARDMLEEVASEGSDQQKTDAQALLAQLG